MRGEERVLLSFSPSFTSWKTMPNPGPKRSVHGVCLHDHVRIVGDVIDGELAIVPDTVAHIWEENHV